jgi:hypothetical protein
LGDGIQDDILTNLSSIRDTFAFMHDRIDAHLRESDRREIASLQISGNTPFCRLHGKREGIETIAERLATSSKRE